MDEELKQDLKEFYKVCYMRLEKGQEMYGSRYINLDLFEEITQELVDIANYAFLEFKKVKILKSRVEALGEHLSRKDI
ncbi:MAG: hypothetical protein JRN15_03675 [Nitrososphaerota archaeon]|nr:hypothetical protein [Nitrososphaerota archaeon]